MKDIIPWADSTATPMENLKSIRALTQEEFGIYPNKIEVPEDLREIIITQDDFEKFAAGRGLRTDISVDILLRAVNAVELSDRHPAARICLVNALFVNAYNTPHLADLKFR